MRNVLIIGDTHIPFEKDGYLDFCKKVYRDYRCNIVVHIGDLVDNHATSYHEHSPNGRSPADEMAEADEHLKKWFKAFPKVKLCKGNHDIMIARKSITHSLPERVIKSFKDIWNLPKGWIVDWSFEIDGVRYEHGHRSGKYPNALACYDNRQSTVLGHAHSVAGVYWTASDHDIIFGLATGCGIDRKKYAFWYGREYKRKPILGCGVVLENGKRAQFVPMGI